MTPRSGGPRATGTSGARTTSSSPEPARQPPTVELIQLPAAAIHALAGGDLSAASGAAAIPLTPYFLEAGSRSVWQRRSIQIAAEPGSADWITRAIWDVTQQAAVGRAGYHGPPDADGMVEIGYGVEPGRRRRGYARAALEALLDRAAREPSVRTVRATISPENAASRLLVMQYGFVEVGEQWDVEDGLETIYEVSAAAWTGTPSSPQSARNVAP